jgi:hypothetical protein
VPTDKISEFRSVFFDSLKAAKLLEEHDGKMRVIDVSHSAATPGISPRLRRQVSPQFVLTPKFSRLVRLSIKCGRALTTRVFW